MTGILVMESKSIVPICKRALLSYTLGVLIVTFLSYHVEASTSLPSSLYISATYGQSWASLNQSSARNVCLGDPQTPGTKTFLPQKPIQNYMLPNWGAPGIGANASFNPLQVTSLLPFYDCGPNNYSFADRAQGQSLGFSVNYLEKKDAALGRGTIERGYFEGGVEGQSITLLSQPADGESCSATRSGPQCYCYAKPGNGSPNGTNGAQCVFPFNQAWVGPTSMLGEMCSEAAPSSGPPCVEKFVTWIQGGADLNTTQSEYYSLLSQLAVNINSAVQATTKQSSPVEFIIEQTVSSLDGSSALGPTLAQLQYIDSMAGQHVHTVGPMYYRHAIAATTVTVSGSAADGDSVSFAFSSNATPGSPVAATVNASTTDTAGTIATGIANAINSNGSLQAAGIYAENTDTKVSVYQPGTLQPPFTLSVVNRSNLSVTFAYPVQAAHEVNRDKVWDAEQIGQCESLILQGEECPELEVTSTSVSSNKITLNYNVKSKQSPLLRPPLVVDTTTLPQAQNDGFALGVGMTRTRAATLQGNRNLIFSGGPPSYVTVGMYVFDTTNPSAIPVGTTVSSISNAVYMSKKALSAIAAGDAIVFGTCQRNIRAMKVGSASVIIALDGSAAGCTLSYALWGPGQQTSGPADSSGHHQLTGFYGAYGNIRDSLSVAGIYSGFTLHNFAMAQQWKF